VENLFEQLKGKYPRVITRSMDQMIGIDDDTVSHLLRHVIG